MRAVIGALGTFQLGLAYLLFSKGLCHVTALQATLLGLVEPLLNPLWVWLGTGERPGFWANVGGAIIILCLVVDLLARRCSGQHIGPMPPSPMRHSPLD